MSAIWYLLGELFTAIFSIVPFFGLWFNKLLILIGFVAFFLWLRYMALHSKEPEM
jgi:hypothetical protein